MVWEFAWVGVVTCSLRSGGASRLGRQRDPSVGCFKLGSPKQVEEFANDIFRTLKTLACIVMFDDSDSVRLEKPVALVIMNRS